ncbi:MAG: ArnT family glycosyltransferase [Candidatus Promineifilaceae bacterium]
MLRRFLTNNQTFSKTRTILPAFLKTNAHFRPKTTWLLILILLIAAALRWQNLSEMQDMLGIDEAYNARDAVLLSQEFELTPFLPDNNGRESAYHYWLIPFFATLGKVPFAMRLGSTILGILTIAALYPMGRQMFNRRVARWSCATLAVFFWHIHMSQLGLRAILQPLIGTLAFAVLWRATRHNRSADWLLGGILTGSLIYTYFSARLWILFIGVWLFMIVVRHRPKRTGALLAGSISILVMLPQFAYTYLNPSESLGRMQSVATINATSILTNTSIWMRAWFQIGDGSTFLNLSGRPVFNWSLGILCLVGFIMLLRHKPTQARLGWLLMLLLFSLLPSLLSDDAPHFLRAIGAVIPLALIIGYGAAQLEQGLQKLPMGWLLPVALLAFSAVGAVRDQQAWITRDDRFIMMEMAVNSASSWIAEQVDKPTNIYYSPYTPFHANVAFHALRLAEPVTHVGAFSPAICVVVPDEPAIYANAPIYLSSFAEQMAPWSKLTPLKVAQTEIVEGTPLFEVYRGESQLDQLLVPAENPPTFINALELHHTPLPETVQANRTLPLSLAFRATGPLSTVYSAFVHLHGDPSPYEGGTTWAQVDSWLCEPYQSPEWQPHEMIVQNFDLPISAETPPGRYKIAVGIYESPAGARIELAPPSGNPNQFVIIGAIEVK